MTDKQEIAEWLKSGAQRCDSALRKGICEICKKAILRGHYFFTRGDRRAHMDCVLSEDVIQELEVERGEREATNE